MNIKMLKIEIAKIEEMLKKHPLELMTFQLVKQPILNALDENHQKMASWNKSDVDNFYKGNYEIELFYKYLWGMAEPLSKKLEYIKADRALKEVFETTKEIAYAA